MPNRLAAPLCLLLSALVLPTFACSGKGKNEPGPGNPAAQTAGDSTAACGPKTCPAGQVCCNESCGICTEPGGLCTQQMCEPAGGGCKQDGDCRAFSDYCTGCDCRALGSSDKDPTCSGPGVRCLADPCRGKKAVCKNGQCTLAAK
jgi:hypothetical protein